eukprot:1186566-Prorocentrum_minimum.AAC.2
MLGPVKRSKSSAQFKMGRAQDYAVTDLGFVPNSRVCFIKRLLLFFGPVVLVVGGGLLGGGGGGGGLKGGGGAALAAERLLLLGAFHGGSVLVARVHGGGAVEPGRGGGGENGGGHLRPLVAGLLLREASAPLVHHLQQRLAHDGLGHVVVCAILQAEVALRRGAFEGVRRGQRSRSAAEPSRGAHENIFV